MERVGPALSGRGWFTLAAGGAVAASVLAIVYLWSGNSSNAVLYAGLSGEEGGRVINELQKLNIPYRITEGGRVILVPATDVGQARLQLAARGVPKQDHDEWALLDNEALGVSPFVEQVHYVRGIEAALSRTVGGVEGVSSAKVTVALPKQTGFLADQPKPSASVMVRLRHGRAAHGFAGQRHRRPGRLERARPRAGERDRRRSDRHACSAPAAGTGCSRCRSSSRSRARSAPATRRSSPISWRRSSAAAISASPSTPTSTSRNRSRARSNTAKATS